MDKLVIQALKPRARRLHEVMASRAGGRMKSPKDYNRQQEKRALKRTIHDNP
jgi:hypothetical protein